MEQVKQLHIVRLLPEVQVQQPVHGSLEEEGVGGGCQASRDVPRGLAAPRGGGVHQVISDEEVALELGEEKGIKI